MPRKKSVKKKTKEVKLELPRPLIMIFTGLIILIAFQAPALFKRGVYFISEPLKIESTETVSAQLHPMGPQEIYVPSLNIQAPLVYITERSETAFQKALQGGVVHYPGTADVGQNGNAYFFGHSSDLVWAQGNYKTVFALLPEVELEEIIIVTDINNHPYRYKTYETLIVNPGQTDILQPLDDEKSVLSVQTSYPVGTALQRFVVRARLLEGPSLIVPKE